MTKSVPYASSQAGLSAREETKNLLQKFGCESVVFMEKTEHTANGGSHALVLVFTFKGINVKMEASARGWAEYYMREAPFTNRSRSTRQEYEQKAFKQGEIAINSILRDWVKGQLTAVESGLIRFEEVFLPYVMTPSGSTVSELMLDSDGTLIDTLLALPGVVQE